MVCCWALGDGHVLSQMHLCVDVFLGRLFCILWELKAQPHAQRFLLHYDGSFGTKRSRNRGLWHLNVSRNGVEAAQLAKAARNSAGCAKLC